MDADLPGQILKYVGTTAILGPSTVVVGSRLANATTWTLDNVERLFSKATARSHGEAGPVNARVLAKTIDEAGITESEITAGYLGGVLASSRTEDGQDDTGVAFVASIATMSSATLALHYALYAYAATALHGVDCRPQDGSQMSELALFVPTRHLFATLNWRTEAPYGHALFSLDAGELITDFASGDLSVMKANRVPYATEGGLRFGLTYAGIELFMWGLGFGQQDPRTFFELGTEAVAVEGVSVVGSAVRISHMTDPAELAKEETQSTQRGV